MEAGQQHLHQPEMRRQEQKVALKVIPEVMEMRRQEQEVTQEVVVEIMKIMNLPMEMEGQVRINVKINLNFFSQVCQLHEIVHIKPVCGEMRSVH